MPTKGKLLYWRHKRFLGQAQCSYGEVTNIHKWHCLAHTFQKRAQWFTKNHFAQNKCRRAKVASEDYFERFVTGLCTSWPPELKMGLSEKSVLKYYHPDAVDYFCVTSNLRQLCTVLKDPAVRISTEVVFFFFWLTSTECNPVQSHKANARFKTPSWTSSENNGGKRIRDWDKIWWRENTGAQRRRNYSPFHEVLKFSERLDDLP